MAGRRNGGVRGDSGRLRLSREVAGADFGEARSGGPANFPGHLAFPQPFDRFINRLAGAKPRGNAEHLGGTVHRPAYCFLRSYPSTPKRSALSRHRGFLSRNVSAPQTRACKCWWREKTSKRLRRFRPPSRKTRSLLLPTHAWPNLNPHWDTTTMLKNIPGRLWNSANSFRRQKNTSSKPATLA